MVSGSFWVCAMLHHGKQKKIMRKITYTTLYRPCWDNIAQEYCLVNVVQIRLRQCCEMLAQSAQTSFLRKITDTMLSSSACANIAQESNLCYVDLLSMNNFARENNLQCYRNLCRPTLRKRITSVILAHSGQKTFFSKITYTMLCLSGCCVYQTNTTLHRNIAYSLLS